MNSKTALFGTTMATILILSIGLTPAFAAGHLTVTGSAVKINPAILKADITTSASIPTTGNAGAFGYAILTDGGSGALDNVLVLVTHLPIDDSSHEDPTSGFHTHVLDLTPATSACADELEVDVTNSVANSAFDSDYNWKVKNNSAKIRGVPVSDLGGATTLLGVAAFTLTPVFDPGTGALTNLCVDVLP